MNFPPLLPAKAETQSLAKELDARFRGHEREPFDKSEPELGDLRFRALMSETDWLALPLSIRRRFSKRLAGGKTVVYVGETLTNDMSRAGWLLAQAARLIGGPLPLVRDAHAPSVVTVTEDVATRGQHWTRLYARSRGFPQVVHSSKRFAGPTGLEEYVGRGVGMALTIHVETGALVFRAAHYFLQLGRFRLRLPRWASPGSLSVTHAELGDGRFLFRLDITHPRLGRLICQTAAFQEAQS
ncbi:MAG: hypothetical protein QOG38_2487 [Hyphomicrobiales bacterium]|jgi:hypothetical protein|nr:hypothetical protein [Hyphomicrobiales bacterium]